uniref:Uncharacterized protein n=1 Tax=Setaria italica TaxID=4555 RepID=K4ANC2_SETIT
MRPALANVGNISLRCLHCIPSPVWPSSDGCSLI